MRLLAMSAAVQVAAHVNLAEARQRSCKAVFTDCVKWCYAQRSGPERHHCKGLCRAELGAARETGVFHREDGVSETCEAGQNVVVIEPRRLMLISNTAD